MKTKKYNIWTVTYTFVRHLRLSSSFASLLYIVWTLSCYKTSTIQRRLKFVFYKETKSTINNQIQILRMLIELDPDNPVWHATLGLLLRLIKNESFNNGKRIQQSSAEESKCFVQMSRDFLRCCRNISEMVKSKQFNNGKAFGVNVEHQRIETVEDEINFMRKYTGLLLQAAETIQSKDDIAKTLATMGEVFSVSLPKQFHDLDLAEKCISTAIEMSPTCSKANHRMGLFQWLKRHDFEKALEYLTAAVGNKNENYYAVIDWIELFLRQVTEKSYILTEIFEELLSNNFSWTPDQMARLIFLKGCFLFLTKGKKKDTMDCWIRAYDMSLAFYFQLVFKEAKRLYWKGFDNNEILKLLTSSKRSSSSTVKRMINEVRKSIANKKKEKKECMKPRV